MDKKNSGVGVLDKAVTILATLESGPHSLAELVAATGIARPTAHRLAVALEFHRLVARDLNGRFIIGPQIFQIVRAALLDPEMEDLPTDYLRGVDFRIHKGSKGGYADYGASKWSRRERALTEDEQNAVKTHGLFKLNDYLPKKPTDVELKVMKEMFEASVDGEPYDRERWGQYFKPAGMGQATGDPNKTSAPRAATPATHRSPPRCSATQCAACAGALDPRSARIDEIFPRQSR